jgi:dTMP kinase
LVKGKIVVCDRFLDSTLAYQGYGLGLDLNLIKTIGKFATQEITPDLTIFLDLPVKDGLVHRKSVEDRIEKRSLKYHARVRGGYLKLAAAQPKIIKIVKVAQHKSVTQRKIRDLIERYVI